ncbi:MAG TPA: helicase C-terminal domain-containing protein [Chloroflexota bacterium]|nr:helicase C-terminal domain-containing protein [Chloroflexota bacterium]
MNRTYVSIDLEMTSLRPENQEIIEIAVIKFQGRRTVESWSTLVNPGVPIPYNIQVLTGIRQSEVSRAPSFGEVAGRLRDFVGDLPLVAHTVSSDVNCLARKGLVLDNQALDTFELSSILLPQLSSYSLAALASHFDIRVTAAHRAISDALVTKELFVHLVERANELDLAIIREINRLLERFESPVKQFFADIEEMKSRNSLGASIRDQLIAKAGLEEVAVDFMLAAQDEIEPLTPTAQVRPIDLDETAVLIEPEGAVARAFPGYEHRPAQTRMLRAVGDAFNNGEHLIVEAGTGTGKSVAYLLPAIRFSVANRERVVVSTNTINLQDQLVQKDLPDLQKMLPEEFKVALVKGRSNYLCLQRWSVLRRRLDLTPSEVLTLIKVLVWLPATQTGDVSELNLTDQERAVWPKLCASVEYCSPRRCQQFRRSGCFLYHARERAAGANVIVVNHALLLSDVAADNKVLPEYRYLIIDEAHHLEDQATNQFGYSVRYRDVAQYLDELSQISGDRRTGSLPDMANVFRGSNVAQSIQRQVVDRALAAHDDIESARVAASQFFAQLGSFMRQPGQENRGYDQRVRLTANTRRQPDWVNIELAWENLHVSLVGVQEHVSKISALFEGLDDQGILDFDGTVGQLLAALRFNEELRVQGQAAISAPSNDRVHWVTLGAGSGDVSFHGAPLDVGEILQTQLFVTRESVVATSATLTTANSFDYVRGRLGMDDARELQVESPFDYASSALVYLPEDVDEPDRPRYQQQLAQMMINLCSATEGRTLALFTSHSQLRQTWRAIKTPLEDRGILVLAHGAEGSSRRHLLQTFKTNPKTVLLGTSSFWEGVDVVGDALSVLVIAKLPFAVPTDPVIAARSEQFDDPFHEYSLPQTILRFKQGFGRLIRSSTDRGVVVIFDRRVQSKSYGRLFLESLPPITRRAGPVARLADDAQEWLSTREPIRR